ncbi:hypothetical protein HDU76_013277 [Blyttiomyces sp. JEL0837]|nr:hypothetical protein HDU76_013277 [Blyttiomyces sp. JEL0837]
MLKDAEEVGRVILERRDELVNVPVGRFTPTYLLPSHAPLQIHADGAGMEMEVVDENGDQKSKVEPPQHLVSDVV